MSDDADGCYQLSLGRESKHDVKCRRQYFSDENNKKENLEDSRSRRGYEFHQNLQETSLNSCKQGDMTTPLQHGSLEFRGCNTVYPCYASYPPPQPAFQMLPTSISHLAPNILHQVMTQNCRPSPILSRGTVMGANAYQHKNLASEKSLTSNIDELVLKIGATFPTVSETHIRSLLKKYHNREAVVMSALQVEKHPIATPGPFSTSPLARNSSILGGHSPFQITPPLSVRGTPSMSIRRNMGTPPVTMYGNVGTPPLGIWGILPNRGSSPVPRPGSGSSYYSSPAFGDYKHSPKFQTSPKMKLRYLKSIFPKVEETLLLDTLASENNNVMKTADKLKDMGFERKELTALKTAEKKQPEELKTVMGVKMVVQKETEDQKPTPPPRMKSLEEKTKMKTRLAGLYEEIPEKLIQMAIESVNFDEEKARHLLMLMISEEKENKDVIASKASSLEVKTLDKIQEKGDFATKDSQKERKSDTRKDTNEKKAKFKREVAKVSRGTCTAEDKEFKSFYQTKATGRNRDLRKGPNDQLLLSDYMTWNGPNPELRRGADKNLVEGPNKNLLLIKRIAAKGPNKENCKGPMLHLAKGSVYSQQTMTLKG